MGEDLALFPVEFNGSLKVEARAERLSGEAGAVILREVIERLGIGRFLADRIEDPRNQDLITHPLIELLQTELLMLGQGWHDRDDADALRDDPVMRLAVSERRGITPLLSPGLPEGEPKPKNPRVPDGLASQPTLSRLGRSLATDENRAVLREALLVTAARRIKAERGGHRMRYVTIDVDSLPVEVEGHQEGSEYNGHYHARIFHPLVASIGETGDLLVCGAQGTAADLLVVVLLRFAGLDLGSHGSRLPGGDGAPPPQTAPGEQSQQDQFATRPAGRPASPWPGASTRWPVSRTRCSGGSPRGNMWARRAFSTCRGDACGRMIREPSARLAGVDVEELEEPGLEGRGSGDVGRADIGGGHEA